MGLPTRLGAAAFASACLAAAGCGYSVPSEADNVRATAATFIESCARERPERAGQMLTEPLRQSFYERGSTAHACAAFLGIAPAGLDDAELLRRFEDIAVDGIELGNSTGTVTLSGPGARRSMLGLARTAGEWLIDTPPGGA